LDTLAGSTAWPPVELPGSVEVIVANGSVASEGHLELLPVLLLALEVRGRLEGRFLGGESELPLLSRDHLVLRRLGEHHLHVAGAVGQSPCSLSQAVATRDTSRMRSGVHAL